MKRLLFALLLTAASAFGQGKIDLTKQVVGVLPSANGGMGTCSGVGAFRYWNGSSFQCFAPPATKGQFMLGFFPTSDSSVSPAAPQLGFSSRGASGNTDTLLYSDNLGLVEYTYNGAVAVSLPTTTTLENPAFTVNVVNLSASSTTITITSDTWTINGNPTLQVSQNNLCTIYVAPTADSWHALCHAVSLSGGGGGE